MNQNQPLEFIPLVRSLRSGLWLLGVSFWLFGLVDRSFAAFSDGIVTATEFLLMMTALFFLIGWLLLKPASMKL
jgi:hypothetical protein